MSEQREMLHEASREIVSKAWAEAQEFARSRGEGSDYATGAFKSNVKSEITVLMRRIQRLEIEARVQDWLDRLKALFQQVEDWALNHNWRADQSGSVLMHEELMQHFKLPAREQPILRLDRDDEYALFKPKGLWVIGANGRLDLFTSRGMFILVDTAEYGDDPQWEIFRATQSRHGDLFSPEIIARLV